MEESDRDGNVLDGLRRCLRVLGNLDRDIVVRADQCWADHAYLEAVAEPDK